MASGGRRNAHLDGAGPADAAGQAEILKLARLLHVPPERLAYLDQVPAGDLRQLREQVTEMLFGAHNQTLKKLAASSKLLPVSLNALITERAFGPVLTARMADLVEPERAVEIASKLSTPFLAEVATHIDPRRAAAVIGGIPPKRIAEISRILAQHGDFVTMGAGVGQLSSDALSAALEVLDDEALMRTAFMMEEKDRLPELVDLLGSDRLVAMIDAAQAAGLEYQAIDLLSHLRDEQRNAVLSEIRRRDAESHQQVLDQLAQAGR